MSDESVSVVEVERQRDFLSAVAEKIVGELGRRGRIVNPSGELERPLRHGVRMAGSHRTMGPSREGAEETMERRDAVHRMNLREMWIHGDPPPRPRAGRRPEATRPRGRLARLEAGAVGPAWHDRTTEAGQPTGGASMSPSSPPSDTPSRDPTRAG